MSDSANPSMNKIAVYWDFENIHSGVQPRHPSPSARGHGFRAPDRLVNVKIVMDYLNSLGDVVINRAYADWTMFKSYRFILMEHAVDLIQLFPRGPHAKNGADIRMAIDAMEDSFHFPDVDVQVIIGGDSDFTNVAQKLRMHGRYVIGIGAKDSSNIYWIKACNEFKYYHTLMDPEDEGEDRAEEAASAQTSIADLDTAKDLLQRAVRRLARAKEDGLVSVYTIRPMMVRLDPSFDESNYGFRNFTLFVEACKDVVVFRKDLDGGPFVASVGEENPETVAESIADGEQDLETVYRTTLRNIHYRLMMPGERDKALERLVGLLQSKGPIEDQDKLKELLMEAYGEAGESLGPEEAQHIWDMGFKAHLYYFQEFPHRLIVLNEKVSTLQTALRRSDLSVVRRLLGRSPVQPLDAAVIARMLYGPETDREEYVKELIGEAETLQWETR